jgi:probable F420-dependent oxidoreductase
MDLGKLGIFYFMDGMDSPTAAGFVQRIEKLGYGTLWIPEALGRDVMASASWLLASTETLNIASGIANIYARDAMATAAAQKTLDEQSGNRFVLGLGVSHKPLVEGVRGHAQNKPLSFMSTYLDAMAAAPYTSPMPASDGTTVIGALHPKMLKLAGEKTAGAHPYLMPPEHTAFARDIMGEGPLLCPEQKVLLETDPTKARAAARAALGFYLELPNYRRSLKRFGLDEDDFNDGGSNRLIDTVFAWGDEDAVRARIQAHFDAGADHVCVQPVDPEATGAIDWKVLELLAPGA